MELRKVYNLFLCDRRMRPSPLSHLAYSIVALGSLYFSGCAAPYFKAGNIQKLQEKISVQDPASKKEDALSDACLSLVNVEGYSVAESSRLQSFFSGKSLEYLFEDKKLFDVRVRPFEGLLHDGDDVVFGFICPGKPGENLLACLKLYDKQQHRYLPTKIERTYQLTSHKDAYFIVVRVKGSRGILDITADFKTPAGDIYTAGCHACLNSSKNAEIVTVKE